MVAKLEELYKKREKILLLQEDHPLNGSLNAEYQEIQRQITELLLTTTTDCDSIQLLIE